MCIDIDLTSCYGSFIVTLNFCKFLPFSANHYCISTKSIFYFWNFSFLFSILYQLFFLSPIKIFWWNLNSLIVLSCWGHTWCYSGLILGFIFRGHIRRYLRDYTRARYQIWVSCMLGKRFTSSTIFPAHFS